MLRISAAKISDVVKELNGKEIEGIRYKQEGEIKGIQALFSVNTDDEELSKSVLKKYLKENYPVYRIYLEII